MEPLKFNALLKSTIWGGEKIIPFKHLDVQQENVGESWEISGVPGNETDLRMETALWCKVPVCRERKVPGYITGKRIVFRLPENIL